MSLSSRLRLTVDQERGSARPRHLIPLHLLLRHMCRDGRHALRAELNLTALPVETRPFVVVIKTADVTERRVSGRNDDPTRAERRGERGCKDSRKCVHDTVRI